MLSICTIAKVIPATERMKNFIQPIHKKFAQIRAPKRANLDSVAESSNKEDLFRTKSNTHTDAPLDNASDLLDAINHQLKLSDVMNSFLTFYPDENSSGFHFASMLRSVIIYLSSPSSISKFQDPLLSRFIYLEEINKFLANRNPDTISLKESLCFPCHLY